MDKETYIQKYLHHELSVDEQKEFDLMMEADDEFKEEVEILSDLNVVNKKIELNHIQGVLNEAEIEGPINTGENEIGIKQYWKAILIGLLLLAIVLAIYFLSNANSKSEALYASYYEAPSNTYFPLVRDGGSGNQALEDAFLAYEQKDYDKSGKLLSALVDYDQNPEIQFYHAISVLEIGNIQDARIQLESIKTDDEFLKNEILWYRALLALKSGNIEQAKDYLNGNNLSEKPLKWREIIKELE